MTLDNPIDRELAEYEKYINERNANDVAMAEFQINELKAENAALRAILAPMYSRFEHDEAGCVNCSACPVCGIEPGTQFAKGVSHHPGCKLAEVMRKEKP